MIAATPEELGHTLKKMIPADRKDRAGMRFFRGRLGGRDLTLVQTGIGAKRASAAARKIAQGHAPCEILSIGAAGAIDPALEVGDIIIARAALCSAGGHALCDVARSEAMAQRLIAAGMTVLRGDCYTAKTFVHEARRKQCIFRDTGALVIDMESACLLRELGPAGCAFVNIRIVSDSAREDAFDAAAYYRSKKKGVGTVAYFAANPAEAVRAAVLKKNIGLVSRRIADILEVIL